MRNRMNTVEKVASTRWKRCLLAGYAPMPRSGCMEPIRIHWDMSYGGRARRTAASSLREELRLLYGARLRLHRVQEHWEREVRWALPFCTVGRWVLGENHGLLHSLIAFRGVIQRYRVRVHPRSRRRMV